MTDFNQLFSRFGEVTVGVVGDLMLDTYMWGKVDRISPEAPVPVVAVHNREYRIGGAGNVALNCRALDAAVSIFSVTGDDDDATVLLKLLEEKAIDTSGVLRSASRITTNKTRVISRNQQMMRLDSEITTDLSTEETRSLLEKLEHFITEKKPAIIILEDYNKGVLTEDVITAIIALCRKNGVLTAVDPKRKNFFSYKGVDLFKPNLKEVREALNLVSEDTSLPQLNAIHSQLSSQLGHAVSFITLSEKGVFYQHDTQSQIIPTHIRNIADVSGAGDTVIAVASIVFACTRDTRLMAEMANIAGGLVCEEVGTAAISKKRLQQECELLLK